MTSNREPIFLPHRRLKNSMSNGSISQVDAETSLRFLGSLTSRQAQVWSMRYDAVTGAVTRSEEGIATALGISRRTVRSHHDKAVKRLLTL